MMTNEMFDVIVDGVWCPRCGLHPVRFEPRGNFVAFCRTCLAFLLPSEFSKDALKKLKEDAR